MQKKWKIILGAAVVLIIGGIAVALAVQGINVDAHEVTRDDIAVTFTEDGTVTAREEMPVYSSYPSHIEEVKVEDGELVEEGDTLVVLEEQIGDILDVLGDFDPELELEAPRDGKVVKLNAVEGGAAGPEIPLFKVFDPGEYEVETMVPVRDVHDIEKGMPVELTKERRGEDRVFPGEVTGIASRAEEGVSPLGLDEKLVKVTVEPDLPGDVKLAPGYGLEVEFIIEEQSNELVIPRAAIYTYNDEDYVFVVEDNRAREQRVTTGLESNREVVITEGLSEGNKVILDPDQEGLDDGTRVDPRVLE